jgi:hypothetical protein
MPDEPPKTLAEFQTLVRSHVPEILQGLTEMANDPNASPTTRAAAAKALRDHARRRVPNEGGAFNV